MKEIENLRNQMSQRKSYEEELQELRHQMQKLQSKPEVQQGTQVDTQHSANSISKYFKELRDVNILMADGFAHKKDYSEIPLSALYSMYKHWCVDSGHNIMQSSNIVSFIKNGNIDKVVYRIVKGNRLIRATVLYRWRFL